MTIDLNNSLVTSLKTRLETDLNAIIDTVNSTLATPAFPIPYPFQVFDFIPTVAELQQLPVLGISDGDFEFQDDVGFGATGICELTVVCFLQHADQRTLAWHLRRYAIALTRCILTGRSLPPDGWGMVLRRVRPGPTLGRDESPRIWLSTVAITVSLRSEQDQ